ncbi:hypothetical protein A3A67_05330 [Candidatus Peribacteria bacterium RIFCSPLOWO2_01_FULL_51_18]|nr:MAG: hypothetical protein A3C52_04295 [Candidatus Peribacteria bacterium RIFCSPHIGHO2_02_FULL_51_15]OGJ66350.1 MAG: hypothetical protein A3A67_05330 [Candidatus Peribacteria bacterium RIFCSPLOWO2_01_FULL_51_18]OGJ67816.1 MAG: hypothetical protein A3J34_01560 [Candidatus Peribacteria bacterium RIFCSPLOWO2_02_FULL_51_10]
MRSISQRDFGQLMHSYLVNVFLFTFALIIYRKSRYYVDFLSADTQKTLLVFFALYLVLAIPLELMLPTERRRLEGKGLMALRAATRYLAGGFRYLYKFPLHRSDPPVITKKEKTAVLFLLVKFYYLPVMTNFFYGNWGSMMYNLNKYDPAGTIHQILLNSIFPFTIALFFFLDTIIYTFGYAIEYPGFRNEIRSVEPTFFGWFIALLCYPPFNGMIGNYAVWSADSNASLPSLSATYALQIAGLVFMILYLWPTFSLGTKASNLTNRGIVTSGPYSVIRHPAYTGKLLGWWVTSIPFLLRPGNFLLGFLSLCLWTTIYFFRALTEERHLIADPDYQEYCRKVPWRFIPYVL